MSYSEKEVIELTKKAYEIRKIIVKTAKKAGGAHFGGALSSIDILTCLYFKILKIDPENPSWEERDRFILSAGHKNAGFAPVLAERGYFSKELLDGFNRIGSSLGIHPYATTPGVEISTGSLGHGLPCGVGMALGAKLKKMDFRVFVLMGDGEVMEGTVWEAGMATSHYELDNIVGIIDRNKLSMDGPTKKIMGLEPLAKKWEAFGWSVKEIDGHNIKEILDVFETVPFVRGKPSMIIADTVKGKGISFMENKYEWHYGSLSDEKEVQALEELDKVINSLEEQDD